MYKLSSELLVLSLLLFLLVILSINVKTISAAPTVEDYGVLPDVNKVAISPSGEKIAYLSHVNNKSLVVVHSLKEKKRLRVVDVSAVKARNIYFLDDDHVFLRAGEHRRVSGFRGKFDVSTGFLLTLPTGKMRQLLVPGDGVVYPGQVGLGGLVGLSGNGRYAFMPAYYGEPARIMNEWVDPSYALLKVKLSGGKPKKLVGGKSETVQFFMGKGDTVLARIDYDEASNKHSVLAKDNSKWVEIYSEKTSYRTKSFVGVTSDNQYLIFLDSSDKTGRTALFKLALKNGEITGPFHDSPERDIEYALSDLQQIVHGLVYSGMTPDYLFFDPQLQKRVDKIIQKFPEHSVFITDYSHDWEHIIVLVEGSQASGDYYLFSNNKPPLFLTSKRKKIQSGDVHPLGKITITARDGLKIPTIITIPKKYISDMKNLPAIMLPHGGPASYDSLRFDYEAQALAQQGYLVIQPQFRGSEGFGREHELAGYGEWGGKMQDDLTDTLNFFSNKGMVDPGRVCIVGSSYGGYAALAGGAFTPSLYQCVVAINGIGNLKTFHSWVRTEAGRSSGALAYWEAQIGGKEYTPKNALERSPAHNADKFTASTLLISSSDDEIVPPSQSKNMAKALRKQNKSVREITLNGDDHHLSESSTRLAALKATIDFVNKHLKKEE